jgi:hypothetical protein
VGKIRRIVLFVLGATIALAAAVLIALNLYVQSEGAQVWIQRELSQRIGTTLRIKGASVTPWGGLMLSGITIPQSAVSGVGDFLQAKSFHLHLRLLPLLSHRLVIKKVALIAPTVVWLQNVEGKWRLPGSEPEPVAMLPQEVPAIPASPAQAAIPTPFKTEAPLPESPPAMGPKPTFVPEIRRLNVTGGNFKFLDRHGNGVATFEGVNFGSTMRDSHTLRGTAKVAKISLRDRFFVAEFRSPVRYERNVLELSKISAHFGGGDISAQFKIDPQAADSPFNVSVKFRNVSASEIVAEAGGSKGMVQGSLDGMLEASGKTADPNALTGTGEISLRDGQLQQYSLLVALGQILQIEELTQLRLNQAAAKYHLSPGVVNVDELVLRSPNIRLSATGTIGFDGKLRLESELAIDEKIRGRLFQPMRDNFQPISEPGYSAIAFHVGGTIDRPNSNLLERMVGRDIKDFVSGLFGGKKSKKKKPAETTPGESGLPTPGPAATVDLASPAATPTPSP